MCLFTGVLPEGEPEPLLMEGEADMEDVDCGEEDEVLDKLLVILKRPHQGQLPPPPRAVRNRLRRKQSAARCLRIAACCSSRGLSGNIDGVMPLAWDI